MPVFHHDDYMITACTSYIENGPILVFHDVFVWDCSSHPCVEVQTIINTGLMFPTVHSYERIDNDRFIFGLNRINVDYNDNIYQCVIDSGNFSCENIFLLPVLDNTTYYDVTFNTMSSNTEGNIRAVARAHTVTNTFHAIHFDCLNDSIICNITAIEDTNHLYGFTVDRILVFKAGEITVMTDMNYNNGRGAVYKLNCDPVQVTNGEIGPNCTVVSLSTISGATPYTNFGAWIVGKVIGDDLGLLVSAPFWGENAEGAIGSLLCSEDVSGDPRAPCTNHEVDLHISGASGCNQSECIYGVGSTAIDGTGYHFAVGTNFANNFRGEVNVYSCSDFPVVLCSHAGKFRPDNPPRSDLYGVRVSYNHNGTFLAVGAGVYKFFYDNNPVNLWTVNTYFNESIPISRDKVIEKIKKIVSEKTNIPLWTSEQDNEYIKQNREKINRNKKDIKTHGL